MPCQQDAGNKGWGKQLMTLAAVQRTMPARTAMHALAPNMPTVNACSASSSGLNETLTHGRAAGRFERVKGKTNSKCSLKRLHKNTLPVGFVLLSKHGRLSCSRQSEPRALETAEDVKMLLCIIHEIFMWTMLSEPYFLFCHYWKKKRALRKVMASPCLVHTD